jgi:hypothetical protein
MSANPTDIRPFPRAEEVLELLVNDLVEAKRMEDAAKKRRVEIEERILAMVPTREEGSETTSVGGFKVTTTGKLAYKADDLGAVREITRNWDANLVPLKTVIALDETGCKYLRRERPDLWAQLARAVTVTPTKPSVKVGV